MQEVPWGRHIRRASQWGSSGGNSYLKECTGDLINLHTNLLIVGTTSGTHCYCNRVSIKLVVSFMLVCSFL